MRWLIGIVLATFLGGGLGCSEEAPPPPPPVAQKAKSYTLLEPSASTPVKPSPPPPQKPQTLAERMFALRQLEKTSPREYRRLQEGWTALLQETKSDSDQLKIKDELESLDSASNKAYRDLLKPIRARIREALDAGSPDEALVVLQSWNVPAEFDFEGRQSKDRDKELALLVDLCQVDTRRRSLRTAYASGDLSRDDKSELIPYLKSTQLRVRVEAEKALSETRRIRSLQRGRNKLVALMKNAPEDRTLFGEFRVDPGPTEKKLVEASPGEVLRVLSSLRERLTEMAGAPTFDAYEAKLKEGLGALERGTTMYGFFPVLWYDRAQWRYTLQGEVLGALGDLEQAISRQRNFVEARMARALLLLEVPMGLQAEKELRVLSRALPEPSKKTATQALALAKEKDYRGASALIANAMRSMPTTLAFLDGRVERPSKPAWTADARASSQNYRVRIEVRKEDKSAGDREAQAKEFVSLLEAARDYFGGILPTPPRSKGVAEILVFMDEESYHDYADVDPLMQLSETAGMFIPDRHQIVVQGRLGEKELREVLIHEAFHEYVFSAGVSIPTWLDEGMADYAAGITVQEGKLLARGRVLPGQLYELQSAIAEGWKGIPFAALLKEDQKEFYGVLRSLQYDQAWSLVHFFKHARNLEYEPLFGAYLKLLVKGTAPSQAAAGALGKLDLDAIQGEWLDYVKALK
jgi:hypothetical protein